MGMLTTVPGPLELAKGSAQGLNLALIGIALAFETFEQFQDFIHLFEALL